MNASYHPGAGSNMDVVSQGRHARYPTTAAKRYILANGAVLPNHGFLMDNNAESLISDGSPFSNISLERNYPPPTEF